MCLCLLLSYTDTKQVQVFFVQFTQKFTNTLPNHLLSKTFWMLASAWGINLVGSDPRYGNEHKPPVCRGCGQSVLISYIMLPNNSSTSMLCYMTTGWEHEQAAPVVAEKWLQLGVLMFKSGTLGKSLPVTPITHSKAPLPTASATLRCHTVSRQKDNSLLSCSGGLGKQADSLKAFRFQVCPAKTCTARSDWQNSSQNGWKCSTVIGRSEFCIQLLVIKVVKCLFRNTNGEVKHSSQISRKALKSSSYHIMLPHVNMKLHRVHMAARGNATVIFLVALQGIWLKCRLKIHADINLNNKQMHFTPLQMAEVWNVYSYHEKVTLFTRQKGSATARTRQGNVAFYNRFIPLTDGKAPATQLCSFRLCSLSLFLLVVSAQSEMQFYEWICEML